MIAWLKGIVRFRDPAGGKVVLEVNGVGYELLLSIQTFASVLEEGNPCELFVHTYVREDQITLYGFASAEEKRLFQLLTSVPKVGPRNAIAVLGGFPVLELVECIVGSDSGKLVKIPGIGKKTAEQIVLTLGDKIASMIELLVGEGSAGEEARPKQVDDEREGRLAEARDVLLALGWKAKNVERALDTILPRLEETESLDDVVRLALASLMER